MQTPEQIEEYHFEGEAAEEERFRQEEREPTGSDIVD